MIMKKSVVVLVSIIALLTSCVTLKQGDNGFPKPPITFENETVDASVVCSSAYWAQLNIKNKTNSVLVLSWDTSSYTDSAGNSHRVVPEGTKYVDMKNNMPPISIPPLSTFSKSFASADAAHYNSGQYGGWVSDPWISRILDNTSFVFGYKTNGKEDFMIFSGNQVSQIEKSIEKPVIVGNVEIKKVYWHILFMGAPEANRADLYKFAVEKAKKQYGESSQLININYVGNWNPASLLLYFSMLGFVETASITADVIIAN